MINLTTRARSLARRLGLNPVLLPLVERWESSRLAELGSYEVREVASGTLEISHAGRSVRLPGLPPIQCELGMSGHERPTMLCVLNHVGTGCVAWDVGANVGFYSQLMGALVGERGRVVAFEPGPATFAELQTNVAKWPQILPVRAALSDRDGTSTFALMEAHSSAGRIVAAGSGQEGVVTVSTARGDSLVGKELPQPAFLKIDVEGHELSVLQGLKQTLSNPECKAVLIEVHFTLLEAAGIRDAPRAIVDLLRDAGLVKQRWIARSHLLARRA